MQTIDIENNMTILIYNNTVICQYGNIDINKDIGCHTLFEWSYRPCGRGLLSDGSPECVQHP